MRWATLKGPPADFRRVTRIRLLRLLWSARLNQSLPGGVSRYRDMRGWIVFLANGGTTLWHPNLNSRRTVPAGNVAHVIAIRMQRPAAARYLLTAWTKRRVSTRSEERRVGKECRS